MYRTCILCGFHAFCDIVTDFTFKFIAPLIFLRDNCGFVRAYAKNFRTFIGTNSAFYASLFYKHLQLNHLMFFSQTFIFCQGNTNLSVYISLHICNFYINPIYFFHALICYYFVRRALIYQRSVFHDCDLVRY